MLQINNTLEILELGWNNFYDNGLISQLFMGLKKNTKLKEIGLSFNGLAGYEFGTEFRRTMIANKSLETINLENNLLTGIGEEMGSGILRSTSLLTIYLGGNPWLDKDMQSFLNVFVQTKDKIPHITKISFGEHKWITQEVNQVK